MKKTLALILIVSGLLIALYPFVDRGYSWYMQQRIFKELEQQEKVFEAEISVTEEDFYSMQELLQQGDATELEQEAESEVAEERVDTALEASVTSSRQSVLGILKIPKINLNLPILEGATEKNLKIGAGRVMGTGEAGEIGNMALAAHRSHTYGRFFNRLGELQQGDEIQIEANDTVLNYRVYKIHVVEPTDISVLKKNNRDKILTLITCDPPVKATHRLIIHAIQYN